MTTRYEYDLDHNGQWRWIATDNDEVAVSTRGYAHLQDCLHAIALMQDGARRSAPAGEGGQAVNAPERTLARRPARLHGPT